MFRKILVPLDGSHLAEQILPHVETLARSQEVQVILLRVPVYAYDTAPDKLGPYRRTLFDAEMEVTETVQSAIGYLKHVRDKLREHGLNVSYATVEHMKPAEAIIQYACENDIDLVAMSTHGYTGIPRAIFGSVANQVLYGVGKPVLLICPQTEKKSVEGISNTKHILSGARLVMLRF